MRKFLLLLAILFLKAVCFAQDLPTIKGDTLYTTSGYKVVKDQDLKIGVGAMPDGDFKFIRTNQGSLFNYSSTTGYQGLANQANALPRNRSGSLMKVSKLQKRGSEKRGYTYYVLSTGLLKYEIDIENAIQAGEIVVPQEYIKKAVGSTPPMSVADEIKKYKALLDAGAITQSEYDAKKKQLLGL
jgi:hypothetical protein